IAAAHLDSEGRLLHRPAGRRESRQNGKNQQADGGRHTASLPDLFILRIRRSAVVWLQRSFRTPSDSAIQTICPRLSSTDAMQTLLIAALSGMLAQPLSGPAAPPSTDPVPLMTAYEVVQ